MAILFPDRLEFHKDPLIGITPVGKNGGDRAYPWALRIHDRGQMAGQLLLDVAHLFPVLPQDGYGKGIMLIVGLALGDDSVASSNPQLNVSVLLTSNRC